jgi:hypothetical protein
MTTQETPASTVTQPVEVDPFDSAEELSGLVKAIGGLSIPVRPSTETLVDDIDIKFSPPEYDYECSLPYSYSVEHSPGSLSEAAMETDLKMLKNAFTGSIPGLALRLSIDTFSRRTAREMALVRSEFGARNGATISPALHEMLAGWGVNPEFKLAFTGLLLGPLSYDLWLLQHVLCSDTSI